MVYSYDRNIQMPTKDLYDTQIMAMALNVAKDEYEKAEKRLDDLNKLYGDFYSPSDVDMKNWQTYVVDPIKNQLDDLYASGIDPTRSAEGKAILARVSRNLPYDKINQLKQSAAVMQENIKNAAELQAKNLYDPEYAKFLKQYPKTWDTVSQGVFSYASPTALPTWHDTVSPYYDKRTAMPLTQEEMAAEGYQFDPMKNYTGYIQKHIEQVADANLPAYLRTPEGQYRQYQAKQQLAVLSGRSPEEVSDAEANAEVKRSWMGAGQEWLIGPEGELDPRKFDDYKTANDIKAHRQKAAITHYYNTLGNQDPYEQSYARDMYMTSIGNIFGVDMYSASQMVADNSAGNEIFNREHQILKNNNYDVDKCIAAHTTKGNMKSNAALIDITLGGSVSIGGSGSTARNKTLSSYSQFSKEALGDKKVYDAADIIFDTAGYAKNTKDRTKAQINNKKAIKAANYFTVSQDVVGTLSKVGQFRTYVKVIGDNGTTGYVAANVDSNKKQSGQAYSSIVANRNQDLGFDSNKIGSIKQRDLVATKLYTKAGKANNDAAIESDME